MNPYEVDRLIKVADDQHLPESTRVEAYLLLTELYLVAG